MGDGTPLTAFARAADALLELRCTELANGQVPLSELVIQQTLSRAPEDYAVATRTALATQELIDEGIVVHPGETVGFVITDAKAHDRERRVTTCQANGQSTYDVTEYVRLLRAAGGEICGPLRQTVLRNSKTKAKQLCWFDELGKQ